MHCVTDGNGNWLIEGDARETLTELENESVGLVFTSPPYYNARPTCGTWEDYRFYLDDVGKVLAECHRVLKEGRFLVVNSSPVLVGRTDRAQMSKRYPVPFDLHREIMKDDQFDFIDDIVWLKPEGAGWATYRGARFAADRNPLQYKTVPVTEYVMVYRKRTDKLIDWNIATHKDQEAVKRSRVPDGYETTNVWQIPPESDPDHPAVFPVELAKRVISYYSFEGDVVLDPYAGSGTVGKACVALNRNFILCEINPLYISKIKKETETWMGKNADDINCVNTEQIVASTLF